jgi:nucleoside-diphosphate-sugar epimerase
MRAIVTGAAGFVGSHLVEALLARGDEVVCIERPGASRRWIEKLPVEWHATGLDDLDTLARLCGGAQVIYHLAGLTEAPQPSDFYAVNTLGTAQIVRAAARHNGSAPRLVLASSIAALGPCRNGDRLAPDTVPFPISHYGESKLLAEAVVHAHADRVPATVLRFPSIYGPRERAILTLFKLVQRGLALTIGSWDREVSLCYVTDAVQAFVAAGTRPGVAGRTYCVAYPEAVSWEHFANAAGRALGRTPRLVSLPVPVAQAVAVGLELVAKLRHRAAILNRERVREMTQERWVCDPSRAIADLAIQPQVDVERGIAQTATWYRENGWL